MPEVSGTETGCLKAGLRPRWNTSLLAAGVLEAALWYWITFFFFFFHVVNPIRTSADLVCWVAGSGCSAPGPCWSEGRTRPGQPFLMVGAVPEEEPELSAPLSLMCCWRWCPVGLWCLPCLAPRDVAQGTVLSPVSLRGLAVSVTVTGSSCRSVSALLTAVPARPGQERVYSVFWFLCQSLRCVAQVSVFLGAFPEKCSMWLLAQGSCAAPASPAAARSCGRPGTGLLWAFWWGRKEKQGLVSISGCKQFSRFALPAIEPSVWPVCAWHPSSPSFENVAGSWCFHWWFFSFFPFLTFLFCIWMLAGSRIQGRAESCQGLGFLGRQQGPVLQQIQMFVQLPPSALTARCQGRDHPALTYYCEFHLSVVKEQTTAFMILMLEKKRAGQSGINNLLH